MARLTTATSIGLALAIALAAGMIGWRLIDFTPPLPESGSADPAVGAAFYAAINNVLAGSNSKGLDSVVTPDFVDHAHGATSDELAAQLSAFGSSFPGTRLTVLGMEPSANSLVVSLAPVTLAPVNIANLAVSAQPFDGGYEVLQIRNGKVAERWSAGLPALSATSFPEATLATGGIASMALRLDRTELPDGAELGWKPGRSRVLMAEAGTVDVRLDWILERELQSQVVTVNAGETLSISSNMKVRVEPAMSGAAQLLIFSMWRVTPTDLPAPSHSGGAASRLLWTSNLPVSPDGGWTVAFGKLLLPQSVDVNLGGGGAMEVLLCTEATAVQVVAGDGSIEWLNADLTAIDRANAIVLNAGSAAHAKGADSIELRAATNAGGAVWLITISPGSSQATPTS